jgi:predicted dehydrogenase
MEAGIVMENMDRRRFLMNAAGATAGMVAPTVITRAFGSPNDRIRVAVVGFHGQGKSHIGAINKLKDQNIELAALCDVDESLIAEQMKLLEKQDIRPKTYTDIRKLVEDKSIDALSIATPNHWHALATIWACQNGKDVYVEKPASHNIFEGRKMVEAARKYNRIVQVGMQSRSSPALREAVQKMREGVIGEVYMARGLCFKWRDTIGKKPDGPVPAGVHYETWLGPAPERPFNPNRFHYNWHWNWDYGNGDNGNQGIHEWDIARWGLGVKIPTKAMSMGGHYMFDDDQQTPNTQVCTLEFEEGGKKKMLVFEVRHWMSNHEGGIGEGRGSEADGVPPAEGQVQAPPPAAAKGRKGGGRAPDPNTIGNIFYGSEGYLVISGYTTYKTFLGKTQQPGPGRTESGNHHANFFQAMRSRKIADLNGDIQEGYESAVSMHLANISYRTGRAINFDPKTEKIVGDAEASKLLTRNYRAPFVVPEKV